MSVLRLPRALVLVPLALLLAISLAAPASASNADRIRHARHVAVHQIGDPYRWGADGPRAFDCSGLVYFATHRAGFDRVPRTSSEQAHFMRHIKKRNLRRGDFLFFHARSGAVYHVAIFLRRRHGEVRMLHAPGTGEHVRRDTPWTSRWSAATLRHRHRHRHR
ncbi:MAG: C40 family peptidase [Nocardioides sp.]